MIKSNSLYWDSPFSFFFIMITNILNYRVNLLTLVVYRMYYTDLLML